MPFNVRLCQQPAPFLHVAYSDLLTIEELKESQEAIMSTMELATGSAVLILDMSALTVVPDGVLAVLPQFVMHPAASHPRISSRLIVLGPSLVATIATIYARVRGGTAIVNTFDEALERLVRV